VLAADIHCRLAAMSGEAAQSHRTVFHWAETFNSGHESVKKGISPGYLPRAHMSTAVHVQLVSCIIMENRHVTIDEPQLTNISLSCKNLCNNPQTFNDDESSCTLSSKGTHAQ
jgi:hypothetical protein